MTRGRKKKRERRRRRRKKQAASSSHCASFKQGLLLVAPRLLLHLLLLLFHQSLRLLAEFERQCVCMLRVERMFCARCVFSPPTPDSGAPRRNTTEPSISLSSSASASSPSLVFTLRLVVRFSFHCYGELGQSRVKTCAGVQRTATSHLCVCVSVYVCGRVDLDFFRRQTEGERKGNIPASFVW